MHSARVQAARKAALDAQRRVDEERLRIARELHDVVAHTMATITVQAAAATQLLRDRPDEAAESLEAIRAASKDGLRELRAILDVLRTARGDADEPADPTQPTPGPEPARRPGRRGPRGGPAGDRHGDRPAARRCPRSPTCAAFRIIQEALTNALRHAGPATAAVTVDYGADELRVEVTDTGRGLSRRRRVGPSAAPRRDRPPRGARAARHARARRGGGRHDRHRPAARRAASAWRPACRSDAPARAATPPRRAARTATQPAHRNRPDEGARR